MANNKIPNAKHLAPCPVCGDMMRKSDMYGICARKGSWFTPKILIYLCEDCFLGFCEAVKADPARVAEITETRL